MRLCLVEDRAVAGLEPLTLTRAAFDLMLGATPLGAKIARAFGVGPGPGPPGGRGPALPGRRPAAARPAHRRQRPRLAGARAGARGQRPLGPPGRLRAARRRPAPGSASATASPPAPGSGPSRPSASSRNGVDGWFEDDGRPARRRRGRRRVDRPALGPRRQERRPPRPRLPRRGQGRREQPPPRRPPPWSGRPTGSSIHETARIDPYTVFDTTNGPITDRPPASSVQPFTRIEGPCFIGRDTQLFRANLRGGVTIGPNCRIGGEVEASIVHGHSNKYHEGFLGHAYVGEWVNLGAITSNSDLRNDYGEVFVPLGGDPVATGQAKVGCFIGDHTRTGLGSMLNTGTADRRDVQRPAGRPAPAEARPVVRGRALRPGRARASRSSRCSPRPGSSWAAAARSSPRSRSSSTSTSTSRPASSASGPSRRRNDRRGDTWPVLVARR